MGYILRKIVFSFSLLVLGGLFIDSYLKLNFYVSSEVFEAQKLILPTLFTRITAGPVLILMLVFYFGIRLSLNINQASLPFFAVNQNYKTYMLKQKRRHWLLRCWFMLIMTALCPLFSDKFVLGLSLHYGMENSMLFIAALMICQLIAITEMSYVFIFSSLAVEKATRFYPEFRRNLEDALNKSSIPPPLK